MQRGGCHGDPSRKGADRHEPLVSTIFALWQVLAMFALGQDRPYDQCSPKAALRQKRTLDRQERIAAAHP